MKANEEPLSGRIVLLALLLLAVAVGVLVFFGWEDTSLWQQLMLQVASLCVAAMVALPVMRGVLNRGLWSSSGRFWTVMRNAVPWVIGLGLFLIALSFVLRTAKWAPLGQLLVWLCVGALLFGLLGHRPPRAEAKGFVPVEGETGTPRSPLQEMYEDTAEMTALLPADLMADLSLPESPSPADRSAAAPVSPLSTRESLDEGPVRGPAPSDNASDDTRPQPAARDLYAGLPAPRSSFEPPASRAPEPEERPKPLFRDETPAAESPRQRLSRESLRPQPTREPSQPRPTPRPPEPEPDSRGGRTPMPPLKADAPSPAAEPPRWTRPEVVPRKTDVGEPAREPSRLRLVSPPDQEAPPRARQSPLPAPESDVPEVRPRRALPPE